MEEKVYIRDLVNKAWGEIDQESLKLFLDQIVKKDKKLNDILPLLEGISHSKTNNNLNSFSSLLLYLLYQEVIEIEEVKPIIDSVTLAYDGSEEVISHIIDFFTVILMVESAQIIHFNDTVDDPDQSGLKLLGNVGGPRKKVFIRDSLIPVNMFNGKVNHGGYVDLERSLNRALRDMNKYLDNDQDSYTDDTKARTPLENLYNITARNLIRLDGGNNEEYESQFRDRISFLLNSGEKNRYIIDKLMILNYGDMVRYSRLLFKDIIQGNPINPINVMDDIIGDIIDTDEEQLIEVIKDIYERYLFNMEIDPDTGEIAEYAPDEPTETKLIEIEVFLNNNDEKNNELLRLLRYIKNRIID